MYFKIVNSELGIASCSRDQVAEDIHNPSTVIFFYYEKRDWIVFNGEHPNFELFLELVQGYIELDHRQRKLFLDQIDIDAVRKPINILIQILRIRKKYHQKIKAA
jgi:hypothetical protein